MSLRSKSIKALWSERSLLHAVGLQGVRSVNRYIHLRLLLIDFINCLANETIVLLDLLSL